MKPLKTLFLIFAALALVKLALSFFVVTPTIYSDEYLYAKLARSLMVDGTYAVHGISVNSYPPLYPLLLSLAYLFQDMSVVYFLMKLLNALASSLIVFPLYFFAKEFFSSKESLFLALLAGILPSSFSFTPYLMAENLFFVLVLITLLFFFRASLRQKFLDYLFAGIFLGLTLLTKTLGFLLVPLLLLLFLRSVHRRNLEEIGLLLFSGLVGILLYLPWFLYTTLHFGLSSSGLLGRSYGSELTNVAHHSFLFLAKNGIIWLLLYLAIFVLSTGVLFFLGTWLFFNQHKTSEAQKLLFLFVSILFCTILVFVINHNLHGTVKADNFLQLSGRPLIRYTDVLLPLLVLTGYLGLKQQKPSFLFSRRSLLTLFGILLLSFPLAFYSLFPANNLSLSWLGTFLLGMGMIFTSHPFFLAVLYVLAASALLYLVYSLSLHLSLHRLLFVFLGFFFFVSLLSFALTAYNSEAFWLPKEQVQLGLWLKDHLPQDATVVVDEAGCISRSVEDADSLCSPEGHTTLLGFWVNHPLFIKEQPVLGDYFISRQILPYQPIHVTENHIYLYKVG